MSAKLLKGKHLQTTALMQLFNDLKHTYQDKPEGITNLFQRIYPKTPPPQQSKALMAALLQIPTYQHFEPKDLPEHPIFETPDQDFHWWASRIELNPCISPAYTPIITPLHLSLIHI